MDQKEAIPQPRTQTPSAQYYGNANYAVARVVFVLSFVML